MNKRICIYGIFLIIIGILIADFVSIPLMIVAISLTIDGLVVIGLGVLLDGQKSKEEKTLHRKGD